MMRQLLAAGLMAATAFANAAAPEIAFKGAVLGGALSGLDATGIKFTCAPANGKEYDTFCRINPFDCLMKHPGKPVEQNQCKIEAGLTFADIVVETVGGFGFRSTLTSVSITMHGGSFDIVKRALSSKYGEPSASGTRPWQQGSGPILSNDFAVWSGSNGQIEIVKMGVGRNEMNVRLSANTSAEQKAEIDAKAVRRAKDL